MNPVEFVFILSRSFMEKSEYVRVSIPSMYKEEEKIINKIKNFSRKPWDIPEILLSDDKQVENEKIIFYELLANSVNYCYWYGKGDIRPNDAGAFRMYELLAESFVEAIHGGSPKYYRQVADNFIKKLIQYRFPMVMSRILRIDELFGHNKEVAFCVRMARSVEKEDIDIVEWMNDLIETFPGYGEDLFLKRASLFFIQLYRRRGWFSNSIDKLPAPADYQIPKILHYYKCISYSTELTNIIAKHEIISSGSLMECEIRAATILACEELAKRANCSAAVVDEFLWTNRKECKSNFHLTKTTDY